jgi:hypothetical protein
MTVTLLHESESVFTMNIGTKLAPSVPESMAGSANLTLFRQLVRGLCHRPRIRHAARHAKVLNLLREAGEPQRYIGELLDLCVHEGGPDGLEVAIDLLSQVPDLLFPYVFPFLKRDQSNWAKTPRKSRSSDDVWYVLARALAQSNLKPDVVKLAIVLLGLGGTWSMRDGSLRALADIGGPAARKLIEAATKDQDEFVRATAQELLESWEN